MTALSSLRWIAPPIALGLGTISLSPQSVPTADISTQKSFAEWCEERADLPPETAHTVEQLLMSDLHPLSALSRL